MKVYFIGATYESCYYVRCFLPLVANGWDGDKTSMRRSRVNAEQMMQGAMASDVIVFHRPLQKEMLQAAILLKQAGKKIVMDNDDTYRKDSGVPTNMFKPLKDKLDKAIEGIDASLKEFAKIADLVTVSTEFLAEEYREFNKNVLVLPNCVEPYDWEEPLKNEGDKVRIGIVGSVASNQDYKSIIPLLDILKNRKDVQLVLFALPIKAKETELAQEIYKPEYEFWAQYEPEWHHFVPIYEYQEKLNSLRLDIMLIPRFESYFNKAKSNVKFLEASMCEIATIAQSFSDGNSPYEKDSNLVLANTEQEWIEKTIELIENKTLRDTIAKEARKYVLRNYNINNKAHLWEQAYANIK